MIAIVMSYLIAVSAVAAVVAHFVEHACRLLRRPARLVWLVAAYAALVGGTLPIIASARATRPGAPAPIWLRGPMPEVTAPVQIPGILPPLRRAQPVAGKASIHRRLNALALPLFAFWAASSGALLLLLAGTAARTHVRRRRWTEGVVCGVPVLVSADVGPAVVGVLRPRIVLPRWTVGLQPGEQRLILAHEQEHARARDPLLLALMMVALLVTPWNPALWYLRRRLGLAMEMDCDARVLRVPVDVRSYGALLIAVAARGLGALTPSPAFAGPSDLRRRITVMTAVAPRHRAARLAACGCFCTALVLAVCRAPHPQLTSSPAGSVRRLATRLAASFTPPGGPPRRPPLESVPGFEPTAGQVSAPRSVAQLRVRAGAP